jgi:peroxiredoxin
MAALEPGSKAPDFALTATDGSTYRLSDLVKNGPVVLFFYKRECPVCQMAAPFMQKFEDAYGGSGFSILGIAQNEKEETIAFAREHGITFPVLLDSNGYKVSKAYGLTAVPTTFLVDSSGTIRHTVVSWSRPGLNAVSEAVAQLTQKPVVPISVEGDGAPDFRPG